MINDLKKEAWMMRCPDWFLEGAFTEPPLIAHGGCLLQCAEGLRGNEMCVYPAGPRTEARLIWTLRRQLPDLMGRGGRERNFPVIRKDRVPVSKGCAGLSQDTIKLL